MDSYTNHEVFYVHSFQRVIGGGEGKMFFEPPLKYFQHMK